VYKSLRNVLPLPAAAAVVAVAVAAVAVAVTVAEGVSVGDTAVVEGDHGQGSFQVVEGHQEDPACGAAGVEGDVQDRTLEDNRLDQDQAVWTLEVDLVQVRTLLEAGSLVVGDRQDRVQALLGHAEGEDHVVDVAVMDQSVADLGEVQKLNRGRGARRGAVAQQGQARHWGWGLVQKVEEDSSRRL